MANPFDQFDQSAAGNPFDQFDERKRDWRDVPMEALQNIPSSAKQFGQNIYTAVTNPVETVKTVGDVLAGGARAGAQAVLPTGVVEYLDSLDQPETTARISERASQAGEMLKERYGSVDALKKTIATDPVGFLADVSIVAPAVDPIVMAGRTAALPFKVGGKVATTALGVSTGAGDDAVRMAARAGYEGNRAFVENMRGRVPVEDIVDQARTAVRDLAADRSNAYQAGMAGVKADTTALRFDPIDQALTDAQSLAYYRGTPLSEAAVKTLDDITAKVGEWKSKPPQIIVGPNGQAQVVDVGRTAEGLDALKQAVGEIRAKTQQGTRERRVADSVYNSIKDQITKQAPQYADVMKGYAEASDELNDITRTFSLGEKAAKDTTVRKLQSVMRNNVNTNFGQRAALMDVLAGKQPDLPFAVAGQAMSSAAPRGLAQGFARDAGLLSLLDPRFLAALPFTSPRVVGEGLYYGGRAARGVNRITPNAEFLRALQQAGRAQGLLGEEEQQ